MKLAGKFSRQYNVCTPKSECYNFAGGKKEKNSETTYEITKEKKKIMARAREDVF
jgi:hypothetical protein